jgi:hypothetical protein
MAFRADEEIKDGYERALQYLVPRSLDGDEKKRIQYIVEDFIDELGSVIESYPSWHPLVSFKQDSLCPATTPSSRCGYDGLDHTIFFANGFITCPYDDGQKVLDSVNNIPYNSIASITAERLDIELYNSGTSPIIVRCNWQNLLPTDGMIPKSIAVPLILEQELPCWRDAKYGETWESMRPYFLGHPHGSRSSLFVNQETGLIIKKIWNSLIYTGMFGPIKV